MRFAYCLGPCSTSSHCGHPGAEPSTGRFFPARDPHGSDPPFDVQSKNKRSTTNVMLLFVLAEMEGVFVDPLRKSLYVPRTQ